MKKLIIAEKPSVATDFARALGGLKKPKGKDYYESEDYIISSAVGHLVELFMPEDIKTQYKRWKLEDLPFLPKKFGLKPIEKTQSKFKELKKLIGDKKVSSIINACDAGREGELIFTYLAEKANNKKPVQRLWLSSMTQASIRKAFENLKSAEDMQALQDAARSRSEADWLIGINGTRAATIVFGRHGRTAATIGRVQTPTLSLVCSREAEIRAFKPQDYWELLGNFGIAQGSYQGIYQKPDFKKPAASKDAKPKPSAKPNPEPDGINPHDRITRLWSKSEAEALLKELQSISTAEVRETQKRSRQSAPPLYDLTSLQREANGRYGFAAKSTLAIAQSLYERHKVLTYPRTDARALPEDYGPNVQKALANLTEPWASHAEKILQNKWVRTGNTRIFNNKKISDHFAIIPTDKAPAKLKDQEQKIYDMVVRRFMAVFFPPAEYDITTRLSILASTHTFKTEGKVLKVAGWLEVYGKQVGRAEPSGTQAAQTQKTQGKQAAGDGTLPALTQTDGEPPQAKVLEIELQADATRPPPHYTEATLLSAMESAGKLIEDEALAEAMSERGLGTPATRAQIIEHLIYQRYIAREGRELLSTQKSESLMEFLSKFDIDALTSPSMTGEWEFKLKQVEQGKMSRANFMEGIETFTKQIVKKMHKKPPPETTSIPSPSNQEPLLLDHRAWYSKDEVEIRGQKYPTFSVNRIIGGRKITEAELQELIQKGEIGPLDGFVSRMGKNFSATLKLEEKPNGTTRASLDFGESEADETMDLSAYPIIGKSPIDASPVHATPNAYISEGRNAEDKPAFRLSRTLLNCTIPEAQAEKLLLNRKTDLIEGFQSRRTGRRFDAFLTLKEDNSLGWEFPPRKATKKAPKQTTKRVVKKAARKRRGNPKETHHRAH